MRLERLRDKYATLHVVRFPISGGRYTVRYFGDKALAKKVAKAEGARYSGTTRKWVVPGLLRASDRFARNRLKTKTRRSR